jgi:hypothetical protein
MRFCDENKTNIIYGSGLSREEMGIEFNKVYKHCMNVSSNDELFYVENDLSKFDSTQSEFTYDLLNVVYQGITDQENGDILEEYVKQLKGKKRIVSTQRIRHRNKWKRDFGIKAQVTATRNSGDCDTSVGNTLLQSAMVYGIIRKINAIDGQCAWAFVNGDDTLIVSTCSISMDDIKEHYSDAGMVAKPIITNDYTKATFCSSFFARVGRGDKETFHLFVKPTALLNKTALTTTNMGYLKTKALRAMKLRSFANEIQYLPCVSDWAKNDSWWSAVLSLFVRLPENIKDKIDNMELVTSSNLEITANTKSDVARRYGVDVLDLGSYDTTMAQIMRDGVMHIETHRSFDRICDTNLKITSEDYKTYDREQLEAFEDYMYSPEYISIYRQYYVDEPASL